MVKVKRVLVGGLAVVAGGSLLVATQVASAAEVTTVSYVASDAEIANPERGPYHFNLGDCGKSAFSKSRLEEAAAEKVTLVQCLAYLDAVKTEDVAQSTLDNLAATFANARASGVKVIMRFAYTEKGFGSDGSPPPGDDTTPAQVAEHIAQLTPVLRDNEDVIAVFQAGFIGTWGEWYYTQNFGNNGNGDGNELALENRALVARQMLGVLPDRKIQVRTPGYKTAMAPELESELQARIGHYNDCFLASASDFGTYTDLEQQRPGLKTDTLHVPVGGETCAVDPVRTTCENGIKDMTDFHWSFLNLDYNKDALNGPLKSCMPDIRKKLGYRFTLENGTFPTAATAGSDLPITLNLRNDGFAAPYNPRGAELVLRNTSTKAVTRLALKADPQQWAAGSSHQIAESVTVPAGLAAGDYELLLNLPDPKLAGDPHFAIQTANTGTWDATAGMNNLNATVTIS